jgi:hypothetical protein
MSIFDIIGVAGVFLCLVAYTLNILQKMASDGWLYPGLNGVSSALILVSLAGDFNLASVLMEGSWLCVSLYGVLSAIGRRRESGDSVAVPVSNDSLAEPVRF